MPLYLPPIINGTNIQTNANFAIQSASASSVGGIIRGATSQTASLQEWQDSAGTVVASMSASGGITSASSTILGSTNIQRIQSANGFSNGLSIQKRGATGDADAAIGNTAEIGYHQFYGWDGSLYGRAAYVIVRASESFAASKHGAIYSIFTTDTGSNDSTEKIRIGTLGTAFGAITASHTITLPNTATGITLYNTSDLFTNYERVRHYWGTDTYRIESGAGGTGTVRNIFITANTAQYTISQSAATVHNLTRTGNDTNTGRTIVSVSGTSTASSGTYTGQSIIPTINQSSTAGYTALLINPTETTTGSGSKNLIDAQVGGSSKFKVDNIGNVNSNAQVITATAGENLVAGNLCYLKSDGKYWKASHTASTTSTTRLAIANATISANASGEFVVYGKFTTSGLTAGSVYFVGTAGAITTTTPTTEDYVIRPVGTALSTTVLEFIPSTSWITYKP